jgi:prolyl-tRNA synthetase
MKDAYSFDLDEAGAKAAYNRMFVAYLRCFKRMGLSAIPMKAESGPIGGELSHEFIVLAQTGESGVFLDRRILDLPIPGEDVDYDGDLEPVVTDWTSRYYAATEDVHDAARFAETPQAEQVSARGIEVGQTFFFGDKYSKPMKAVVSGPDGVERPVQMGSYGVGISRLLGAIIEASHDEAGIIWPDAVAPFGVGIISLRPGDAAVDAACEGAYAALTAAGLEPLYDDTDERPGGKFAVMDLIGLPWQLIIGPRGLAEGNVELKRRASGERLSLPLDQALAAISG